jgi:adenine phosphoribosyltransferase
MAETELMVNTPGVDSLRRLVRDVPDFPSPGILFKDITPLLADAAGLALSVEMLVQPFRGKGIELVVGVESRGFVLGSAVAHALSAGLILVRKPGKLPGPVRRCEFDLEYGSDALEIHEDAIESGQKVLIIDDVLATGGTLAACCELVAASGARIDAIGVLIELMDLGGRARLENQHVVGVLQY